MNRLIASAALIAASTALASATTVTVDIIDILDSDSSGWLDTNNYSGNTSYDKTLAAYNSGQTSVSADAVAFAFGPTSGVYASYTSNSFLVGAGNLNNQTSGGPYSDLGTTTLDNVSEFTLTARTGYSGTWVAVVISVDTLLAQSDTATTDDLTTINISYTTDNSGYPVLTAWVVSTDDDGDDTATALTVTTSSGDTSVSGTIDVSSVTEDDVIVVLLSSAGQKATVTGLSLTTTIPEPSAFALLAGVGALAFAVSRRRRSRRA